MYVCLYTCSSMIIAGTALKLLQFNLHQVVVVGCCSWVNILIGALQFTL